MLPCKADTNSKSGRRTLLELVKHAALEDGYVRCALRLQPMVKTVAVCMWAVSCRLKLLFTIVVVTSW